MPERSQEDSASFYPEGQRWSGHPNLALTREAGRLNPGTALDVGCGEGADLAWLAEHGWQATGIDPVDAAVERTRALIDARGLTAGVEQVTLADFSPDGPFDLVACSYLPVREEAIADVEKLISPGGVLLWVHHDFGDDNPRGFVPPARVAKLLGDDFTVIHLTTTDRDVRLGAGAHHHRDVVLVAARAG